MPCLSLAYGTRVKLGWYLNRLRSMEPAEVVHRLREYGRKLVSRSRGQGWVNYPARSLHPVFPAWRAAVLAASPEQRRAIVESAENALSGKFSALGRDWPVREPQDLFPADIWRFDPVSGQLWPGPEAYTFDIDFRHSNERGDIKYVWEFNRLQQLPVLAAHFVLTSDSRPLTAIEAAIASWHSANPPFSGVGWASGIEVALRAISLIVTVDLAGDQLSAQTKQQVGEILGASAYWLARFPSRFSSANNHLVAELAGEYLIALALGEDGSGYRKALADETLKQILPDGAGAEQSPTYAAFTAELILICAAAAGFAGQAFPQQTLDRLGAFAAFAGWLPHNSGGFGDDDEGRALTLGDEANYVRSISAVIRGFTHQAGQMPEPDDFRSIFFGSPVAVEPERRGLITFGDGGLSVWRGAIGGRAVELAFDHGPLGYLSIAAHGHADALSLNLWIDGEPVLVDPGTWLYGSGGVWRDWLRSTPAHNTLNIDGQSQSVMSGAFNWSHKANTRLEQADDPNVVLRARHDGYKGRFGVDHQRSVQLSPEGIEIVDRLLGNERRVEIVFQLASGLTATQIDNVVNVTRNGEPLLSISLPDTAIHIQSGGERPGHGGWVSVRFGERHAAQRIVWQGLVGDQGVNSVIKIST